VVSAAALTATWDHPLQTYNYREREAAGEVRCIYTFIPFSPTQSSTRLYVEPPGGTVYEPVFSDVQSALLRRATAPGALALPKLDAITVAPADLELVEKVLAEHAVPKAHAETIRTRAAASLGASGATAASLLADLRGLPFHRFLLGSDPLGQDVLSQLMHACRLSISIGLVSTGIAVLIGVTLGALMGYFGGWVDLFLYRVVEVFMAIPVLFLLIVAAAVLPRNTYVMMAIIGCVTWTGAARFIRAEFFKLRNQDFVQSARAVGLPLRSILFKHMLPNGVTPVLVDSSFAVAAAILAEATLSFLGLGPDGQASWGKLLSSATGITGTFVWWLAIFPGFAIFLTVLSYNLIGEALRDAIDPKLKKARV
jgi:ABC-type dipeptide/oligopeptide/nickel transport system permease subunit